MVVLDQTSDLRRDFLPFPSHHEKLAHGPISVISKVALGSLLDAYLSKSSHIGSNSSECSAMSANSHASQPWYPQKIEQIVAKGS
jgi:hypothetical protein